MKMYTYVLMAVQHRSVCVQWLMVSGLPLLMVNECDKPRMWAKSILHVAVSLCYWEIKAR